MSCQRPLSFLVIIGTKVLAQDHQDQFSAQRRFICPWGSEDRDKREKEEIEYEENGEGTKGVFVSWWDKGLNLDSEETDMGKWGFINV